MIWWFAVLLVFCGAAAGVVGYVLWSSRDTHSDHSNYDTATSVRTVLARVMGERWAERYGYSALQPAESADNDSLSDCQPPYARVPKAAGAFSAGEATQPIRLFATQPSPRPRTRTMLEDSKGRHALDALD
ncbi:hypothetical protein Atai01_53840 [Amycolatopsis taiwanensis]|uniref:Uncharacterized protein n=1 Tax=Amycolatopsis taiwanensis TaxID=342230 RepID=A0A9W6VHJ3_9PSEU|nr:hypothetical protein Atai01_53840 [Amycolatopsis taiwanensis]